MLTGARPFQGNTVVGVMAAILEHERSFKSMKANSHLVKIGLIQTSCSADPAANPLPLDGTRRVWFALGKILMV